MRIPSTEAPSGEFRAAPLFPFALPADTPAEQFAGWLPYSAYLAEEKLFVNRDGMGFLLEVMPQSGADERMAEVLVSLYANCPPDTGLQFHLFASPHIRHQLRQYTNLRVEDEDQAEKARPFGRPVPNENLFRKLARQRVQHLLRGTQTSLTAGFHYTLRDFRLMLSVSFPGDAADLNSREALLTLRDSMAATLRAAMLPNRVCDAADLINWCALFTNPDRIAHSDAEDLQFDDDRWLHYDDGREIRDQIVDFDTIQDPHPSGITLWKETSAEVLEARFYSIKSFPEKFALWQMGSLIGDLMQPALQYSAPFLITLGVHILDPNATKSVVTANHVRATQNAKSKMADVMPDVRKKLDDWSAAANAIDTGGSLVSLYHQLAIFTHPDKSASAHEAANAIWRARGFQLNSDAYMHRQALLASLPMTLTPRMHKDLGKMRRVTRKTMSNAIHMAPLIAEWRGTRTPALVFGGRRGQVMTLDLYDNDLGNYNFAIIGAPGSGNDVVDGGAEIDNVNYSDDAFDGTGKALTGLGVVKCWGNNDYGQIGDNTTIHRVTPVEVLHLTGATALAAGFFHSCAVTGAGGVACWGGNLNGQLGDGTVINRKTPVAVVGLGDVTAVAANGRHSCALTKEGGVRCWGYGPRGQLGHGSFTGSLTPVIVNGLAGATAVVAGEDHSCALLKSGTVKCWGFNAFGQLGNGNTQSAASPVDVRDLTGVVALAAGRDHTCAYTECGLFCVTLLGCGQSPRESMAQCENDAQKATVGMVSNDSQIRSQIEAQRIELVRSCMVSRGFKFKVSKFESDRRSLPIDQWGEFNKRSTTNSDYWE